MNHIYRLVWNDLSNAWVVVAEIAKGRGKRSSGSGGSGSGGIVGHAPYGQRRLSQRILAAALAVIGVPAWALDINALPSGGKVVAGAATISQAANVLTVQQASQRAALDWQSFNIGAAATVNFVQPGSSAVALNRIVGNEASQIYGKLNSNGQVFFSNPNGMLFARGAQVNVGGLLATTMKLGNEDFMAGNYRFNQPGIGGILNEGLIKALGSVALVGNDVKNSGQIFATTVTLAAGNTVAVDLTGDGLIRARVDDAALRASIENSGSIDGAAVAMTTGQARKTLDRVVNNSGVVRATGLASVNGEIVLEGGWVANTGTLKAGNADGGGGRIALSGTAVAIGGTVAADGATQGGSVAIDAHGVSLAGLLSATGVSGQGGRIDIQSQTLAVHNVWSALDVSGAAGGSIREVAGHQITSSATYRALGSSGQGGRIDMSAPATKLLSAQIDASGAGGGGQVRLGGEYQGGKHLVADELPNAETLAISAGSAIKADATRSGDGGTVILWSDRESALYSAISATGKNGGTGGFVELSSADNLKWGGSVNAGVGGRVLMDPKNIVIQDASADLQYNLVLGYNYNNLPRLGIGLQTLDSFGFAVALSGTQLAVGATGDDGFANGAANSGAVYLFNNPYTTPTLAGVIGKGYTGTGNYNLAALEDSDSFGASVALSGTRLAVGATGDDGYNVAMTTSNSYGAVYLFNNPFSATPTLTGTLGKGYTGTGDYDASALTTSSGFGTSVALSGTQLAAGVISHRDAGNDGNLYGAVYLFTGIDTTLALSGIIGKGYTGSGNYDLAALENLDAFGRSVSLSGTQLAVGASGDDAADNLTSGAGAVYLFNTPFSAPTLTGTIGKGYTGAGSYNFSTLKTGDTFGTSLALSGTRLAVGAFGDDGYGAVSTTNYGAVHLFNNLDSTPTLTGTLGKGYTGSGNLDMAGLKVTDGFGRSVALAGTQLAVGASGDDGFGSTATSLNYGAVYLFNSIDSTPTLAGTLGSGYTGTGDFDLRLLKTNDAFGSAVSLSGTQLAVGAYGDQNYAGAVYLFSNPYTTPTLAGVIGKGYAGSGNFNLGTLEPGDLFGGAVSLSGTQLAVGAMSDAGADNATPGAGAVYLFNNPFSASPTLAGVIGKGYTGTGSFNLSALEEYDTFGSAVSLSGAQLAVGAYGDGGFNNLAPYSGAVYLFNNPFTAPALAGTIGKGYTGTGNHDLAALEAYDYFGSGVSLSGTQLAVGAAYDSGADNTTPGAGAVYLLNSPFADPALAGIIGKGYSGSGSYDLATLEQYDSFGSAVSMSGTQLAVGAIGDAGFGNVALYSGAVYLLNNLDTTPTLAGIIGKGYTGTGNFNLSALEENDYFGIGVSLSGTKLAVGAPNDFGFNNTGSSTGAVYLFSMAQTSSDPASGQTFAANPGTDATITPASIVEILNTGAALTLQANNDITVASNILVNNPSGNGGALTMQAGRSILVNAAIDTDSGALTLTANHAGADPAHRDAGTALLDASTASLRASTMQFSNTGGDILLNNLTASGAVVSDAATFTQLSGTNSLTGLDVQSGGVSGAGTLNLAGGSTALSGALNASALILNSAALDLYASSALDSLTLDSGSLVFANIGTLGVTSSLSQSGIIVVASGATVSTPSFTNDGILMGFGTFLVGNGSGTLTNAGAIRPGDSDPTGTLLALSTPGTLTIDGSLAMTDTGRLYAKLNGTASGSHDKLAVTGTASFAAGSTIDLFGFGGVGDYAVVTATGGVSGTPTIAGNYFTQTTATNANDVTVTATANLLENALTWDGGANTGNWEDAVNWSTDSLPGSGNNIFIDGGWIVANSSGISLAKNLVSRSPLSLSGGSLTLAGSAVFSDTLALSGGTLTGAGAITIGGALDWGGGTIDATTAAPLATLSGSVTSYRGGTLGANRTWTSSGNLTLLGNLTTATLPAFIRGGGSRNLEGSGDVEVGAAGISSVNLAGSLDNSGATLDIGSGGIFGAGGLTSFTGTIRNGTVVSLGANAPALAASGSAATLDGVTLGGTALATSGNFIINNGLTLTDGTTVDLGDGTWKFGGSGIRHIAVTTGTATLDTVGGSLLAGYNVSGQTLQIDSGVTLRGYGSLAKVNAATIVNAGTISANTAGLNFAISPTTFTNSGTLNVTAGTMSLTPTTFTQSGNINIAAGANLSTPTFTNNGTITGSGTLTVASGSGTLTNARLIAPGDMAGAAGTLTINGHLTTSGSSALLTMDLNGASDYDRLAVSGNVSFASGNKIELSGVGGAASYPIVTASGTVSGTPNVTSLNFTQTTAATANAVTVTATANTVENAIFWDSGADTWNWMDAANWSTNTLPTSADNVLINTTGTVSIAAGALAGKNLVSQSNFALSGGSLDLAGTALFNKIADISGGTLTSAGAITFASGSTFNWTGGTLAASAAAALATQAGSTANFTAGTLGANLTWTSSGSLNLAGNVSLAALPAFTRAAGSTVNVTGVLDLGSSTLDIGDAGRFGTGGLSAFSGTLKNGSVRNTNASPTLASSSGTLDAMTLEGTALTTSGTLNINNGITLASGMTVNKGSTTWNFGTTGLQHITTAGTATLTSSGGSLVAGYGVTDQTLQIDAGITLQGYGALTQGANAASIINAGTLSANTAGQTLTVSPANFSNNGTLNISGGTLSIAPTNATAPNWSNAGTLSLTSGILNLGGKFTPTELASGHYSRTGGTVNVTGTLDNSNNTLDIGNAGLFGNGGLAALLGGTLKNGTVLSTNATPTLTGTYSGGYPTLDGVTLGGTALTTSGSFYINNGITLADGVTVNKGSNFWNFRSAGLQHIATTGAATLNNNAGDISVNLAGQTLQIDSGVSLQGYGSLYASSDAGIINAGTISANSAGYTFTLSPATFTNSGTVNVSGGNLNIAPSGTTGPSWSNTGTLNLTSGTLSLGGKFTAAGLGSFARSGGTVNLTGTLDNSNNTLDLGSANLFGTGGLNAFTGTIKNGIVLSTAAVPTLTSNSGRLDGVTLGGTTLTTSGTLLIDNGITLANGVTVNKGSDNWYFGSTGLQHLATTGTATLNSAGGYLYAGYNVGDQTLQIDNGVTLQGYGTLAQGYSGTAVINAGTIRANTTGQSFTVSPATFTNTGTLNVTAGSLSVTAASITNHGTVAANGGSLSIYNTTFTNNGTFNVSGGTVYIGNVYYPADTWTNPGTLNLASGTLNLGGTFTAAALASGHYSRTAGSTLNLIGTLDNTGGTVDIGGTGLFGPGGLTAINGGTIKNGTVTSGDASALNIGSGSTATLDGVALNAVANISGGTLNLTGAWSNPGRIDLNSGTLDLGGTFTAADLTSRLGASHYTRAAGSVVKISGVLDNTGNTLDIGSAGPFGSGGLTVLYADGTIKNGTVLSSDGTPFAFEIVSTNTNGTWSTAFPILDGVTLGGTALTTSRYAKIKNGITLANGLTATITKIGGGSYSSVWSFEGSGTQHLAVANGGTATVQSASGDSNGHLLGQSGVTGQTLQIDAGITLRDINLDSYSGAIINAGTITATGNAFSQHLHIGGASFTNNGTLNLSSPYYGMEVTATAFTQNGTLNLAPGAAFSRKASNNVGTGFTNSGSIAGSGTVNIGSGTLINNGTLAPGVASLDTTGTLSISGSLTMGAGSRLNIDLNTPLATDYDVLSVAGTANLTNSTIYLSGIGGAGSYPVVTASGGLSGTATINAGGFTQTPTYAGTSLTLGVTANSGTGLYGVYWDRGANTNNWHDAANWSNNQVPTASDNVYLGSGAGTVAVSTAGQAANGLSSDADFTLSAGSLSLGGASVFRGSGPYAGGKVTTISGGTLTASGAITLAEGAYLQWTGGTIDGATATTLTTQAGAEARVTGGTLGANLTWNNSGRLSVKPQAWTKLGTLNHLAGEMNLGVGDGTTFTAANLFAFNRSGGTVTLSGGLLDNTGNTLDIGSNGPFGAGGLTSMSREWMGQIKGGIIISSDGTPLTSGKYSNNIAYLEGVTLGGTNLTTSGSFYLLNNLTLANGVTVNSGNGTNWTFGTAGTKHLATTGTATFKMAGGILTAGGTGDTLQIDSGVTLQGSGLLGQSSGNYGNNTLINAGTINATAQSFTYGSGYLGTGFMFNPGTLTNNGTLNIDGAGYIYGSYPTTTLNNAGTINVNSGTFSLAGGSWTNAGSLNLNGGTLNLGGTFTANELTGSHFSRTAGTTLNLTGTLNNAGNTLDIGSAGLFGSGGLNMLQGTIANGTVVSNDGTTLTTYIASNDYRAAYAKLDSVTLGSNLTVSGNLAIKNNLTLADAVTVNTNGYWVFNTSGATHIATPGTATINSAGTYFTTGYGSSPSVQLDSGVTLRGYGGIGGDSYYIIPTFINAGTISADTVGKTFTINAGNLTNSGTLYVAGGAMSVSSTTFNQSGTIDVVANTSFTRSAGFTNTGTLTGSGAVVVGTGTAKLVNQGNINPGGTGAAGTLSITGDLQLTTGSNLNIEAGGTAAGQYDKLTVSGAVTLGATLNASLLGGYMPAGADVISFLTMGGTASGAFVTSNLSSGFNAGYNLAAGEAARLIYAAPGTRTFTNSVGGLTWETPGNWSSGFLPGSGDTALISGSYAVVHGSGTDSIAALTVDAANSLNVTGGSLAVSGITSGGGTLSVSGGTLSLNGPSSIAAFNLNSGTLNGSGSLTVTNSFSRSGGTVGSTFTGLSITQASGDFAPGAWTVNGPVSLTASAGSINASGSIGSNGALTLKAGGDIALSGTATLTSNGGNVVLNSDSDASGSGAISIGAGTSINSNGGNINLGGGAEPATSYARGNAIYTSGINIAGNVSAAGGNIVAHGQGVVGVVGAYGVSIVSGGQATTTGSGNISLSGITTGAGTDNHAVFVYNSGTLVQTVDGNINLTGDASANTGKDGIGVVVSNAAQVMSSGIGSINAVGDGSTTSGEESRGVDVQDSGIISTQSGSITLTGASHATAAGIGGNHGVHVNGGGAVSSTTGAIGLVGTGAAGSAGIGINHDAYFNYPTSGSITSTSGNISLTSLSGTGIDLTDATLLTGGNVTLTATGGGSVIQTASTAPTSNKIVASGLELLGTGATHTLGSANNAITTVAGNTGAVNFTNNAANWSIGTVNTTGLTTTGSLTLDSTGTITATTPVSANIFTLNSGTWNQVAASLPVFTATDFRIAGGTFIRAVGGDGTSGTPYQLADIYGVQGMGSSGMLGKSYTLANDVSAAGTAVWNGGAGFAPVGNATTQFTGTFDGLGHTISSLTINRPAEDFVGLFGYTGSGSAIRNVGLIGGSVSGYNHVGELVGFGGVSNGGTISNSYTTGSVIGHISVGGLIGSSSGGVSYSYSTGSVSGSISVGGLMGTNYNAISNSYATGSVVGTGFKVGGLVGTNSGTVISTSYATGSISGTTNEIGGLVGGTDSGTVSNSYWNTTTSGQAASSGGTGLTTADMMQLASFASWNTATPNTIANIGASGAVWRVYEGLTYPLLRSFLTPLTLSDVTASYNGTTQTGTTTATAGVLGSAASGRNAGSYTGYYSGQQGYDISGGNLTISPASLTLSTSNVTKTYDGDLTAAGTATVSGGTLFGSDRIGGGAFAYTDKNAGSGNKTVTVSGATVTDGNSGYNYSVSYASNTASTINPAVLTASITGAPSKTYDGTDSASLASGNYSLTGLVGSETFDVIQTVGTYNSKDVAIASTITAALAAGAFTGANGALAGNYTLPTSASGAGSITARSITVTADSKTMTYGDGVPSLTYSVGGLGLVAGDNLSGALASTASVTANVGNYAITQNTLDSGTNYALTYLGNSLAITAAPLTVTADNQTRIYGDGNPTLTGSITGFKNGETSTVLSSAPGYSTAATTASNVASYPIVGAGATAGNYSFSYVDGSLSVTPATLTLTADAKTRVYGDANPTLTYIPTGFKLSDSPGVISSAPTLATTAIATSNVGSVPITVAGGNAGGNYTLAYSNGSLAITARPLTVTASAKSKSYGDSDPTLGYAIDVTAAGTGLVNGDTLGGSLTRVAGENVITGPYAITQGSLAVSSNYSLSFNSDNLTITPRPLTATVAAPNKIYDGNTTANPALTITSGLVGGETVGAGGTASFNSKDVLTANLVTVNSTSLSDGTNGGLASNYSLAAGETVAANILAKSLTATVAAPNKTYDGNTTAAPTLTITAGLVGAETVVAGGTASYNSKDVLTANLVTVNSTSLSDGSNGGLASNYSLVSGQTTAARITQRPSVDWVGGSNGQWSNAANWAGGALPDNDNVAEARFVSGGSVRASDTRALNLGNTRVTVQSGDLEFDITGGIHTGSGLLRALAGRISLIAHSPITIGSGGVQAAAGVSLAANTADSTSTISINGALNGGTGVVNLGAYSNITQNATLSGSAIAMSSTSGNIVIAASATNSVSAGGSIQISAPQGTVASSSGNFSGAAPVIADSTPPPVIAPTNTASTEIATTLQTVMDPLPPPPPTDSVVVSASPTSVAAPEVAPAPAPTTTTPAASTNQDAAASSQPAPASASTATNAPAAAAPSSDAATPAAGTTDVKSGDATKSAKTEEKSETKPAPKPAVQTVTVANSTVQKPADQVMQVERPKGRLLVCKG